MDGTLLEKKYDIVARIEALEEGSEIPDNVIVEDDVAYQFSTTASYLAGSFVYKDNQLYRFDVDHDAGAWNTEEVTAVRICDSIISEFGDGLHRTGNEVYVKLQAGGGLAFDGNGALYTNVVHNYSTNEQSTGRNWIDGKPIYSKTFNAGSLPASGNVTIQNDISNFGHVVNVETVGISNDGYSFANDGLVMSSANSASLVFRVTFDATGYNGYVTLYYTKNTTSSKKTNK